MAYLNGIGSIGRFNLVVPGIVVGITPNDAVCNFCHRVACIPSIVYSTTVVSCIANNCTIDNVGNITVVYRSSICGLVVDKDTVLDLNVSAVVNGAAPVPLIFYEEAVFDLAYTSVTVSYTAIERPISNKVMFTYQLPIIFKNTTTDGNSVGTVQVVYDTATVSGIQAIRKITILDIGSGVVVTYCPTAFPAAIVCECAISYGR